MPLYDYRCEKCGKVVEVWHAMSESGEGRTHDGCDGRLVRQLASPIITHDKSHVFTPKQLSWIKRDYKSVSYKR